MTRAAVLAVALFTATASAFAHSGPPFPIVTDAPRGPYSISIWTDPDATENGTPGGQFWIVINPSTKGGLLPPDTRATVSVHAMGATHVSPARSSVTTPVRGDITNQFGAVLMDHEGPYAVRVEVTGALGQAIVESMVDATYDLRPPPYMLIWYLVPFLLAGMLWTRLLLRRRSAQTRRSPAKAGRGPSDRVHVP